MQIMVDGGRVVVVLEVGRCRVEAGVVMSMRRRVMVGRAKSLLVMVFCTELRNG